MEVSAIVNESIYEPKQSAPPLSTAELRLTRAVGQRGNEARKRITEKTQGRSYFVAHCPLLIAHCSLQISPIDIMCAMLLRSG